MARMNKDVAQLVKRLQRAGCDVDSTSHAHIRVSRPGYRTVFISRTPSDYHALKNIKQDIRRNLDIRL